MPSVNSFITALVAGLAIGAQAGPCRPHAPSSSVVQSQVTTTKHTESAAETSAAYTDAVNLSETGISLSTSAAQVTSSTEAGSKPTTTDENETSTADYPALESSSTVSGEGRTTTTAYPVTESSSATEDEDKTTTTAYSAAESTSVTTGALTTDSANESTSPAEETISSVVPTTDESSAILYTTTSVPSTTSSAEIIPSATSSEPKTTLDTMTIASTTTSSEPTTTTPQTYVTTSAASTSSCPILSKLSCALTGYYSDSESHLLDVFNDTDLDVCRDECAKNDRCNSIGLTDADQCELYDTAVSGMGFSPQESWYYTVYDACCFEVDGE
ncbi:hypothetical protein ACHAPU_006779 [Fusarium lateritium]